MADSRLDGEALIAAAMDATGESDFGGDTWREGMNILLDGFRTEADLNGLGVEVALNDLSNYLADRLRLVAWRRDHPEIASIPVTRPIVIVGQPRTGTTILYDLLSQDPELRAPLTWEVDKPIPPPGPSGDEPDPRIAEVDAALEMANLVVPGFTDFHPMGATLSQECVRITGSEFASMIFPVQYRVPTYNRWLIHEADMAPAYAWHRRFLQHLASGRPTGQWLLKSPAHLWCLDALLAEYPDAIVIQTHRDPLKVIASVSALATHLQRMTRDDPSLPEIAEWYADDIVVGLQRGMDARRRGVPAAGQVIDVQFSRFMADPFATIGSIYAAMGRELTPDAEARMRRFLAENPGDGGGGGTRYRWADTGLDADTIREQVAEYQEVFDVPSEPVV